MLTTERLNRNAVACIVQGRLMCHMPREIEPGHWPVNIERTEPVANATDGSEVWFMRRRIDHALVVLFCQQLNG
jgi:hypothetical protein